MSNMVVVVVVVVVVMNWKGYASANMEENPKHY
jgi:hypothetical protein